MKSDLCTYAKKKKSLKWKTNCYKDQTFENTKNSHAEFHSNIKNLPCAKKVLQKHKILSSIKREVMIKAHTLNDSCFCHKSSYML